jgi:cbb3-type cytochrome oxidase subunit 3
MSQVKIKEKKQSRVAWPLMGFLLAVGLGIIAWYTAPLLREALPQNVQNTLARLTDVQEQLALATLIFFILLMIAALIVAIFAPKRRISVNEADMLKERNQMIKTKDRDKRRQRAINRVTRDDLRAKNKERRE